MYIKQLACESAWKKKKGQKKKKKKHLDLSFPAPVAASAEGAGEDHNQDKTSKLFCPLTTAIR
jgi:hypothetical protein